MAFSLLLFRFKLKVGIYSRGVLINILIILHSGEALGKFAVLLAMTVNTIVFKNRKKWTRKQVVAIISIPLKLK